jgi:hypothetical protein
MRYLKLKDCQIITIYTIILLFSTLITSCLNSSKKCADGLKFSSKDSSIIPYLKDKIILFQNKNKTIDTFYITNKKIDKTDYYDPIETGHQHYIEFKINYTNKRFNDNNLSRYSRELLTVKKNCENSELFITSEWLDYHYGLQFDRKTGYIDSYPDTLFNYTFENKILPVILKFQTDTLSYPDAIENEIKTIFWLPGKGIIKYESSKTGWWTRIN